MLRIDKDNLEKRHYNRAHVSRTQKKTHHKVDGYKTLMMGVTWNK